ncbi:MAG: AAA family ATPase [Methanophagales archaeon ANME-1-THS]|nr:MAG: AAA family ATPase [Methanophagales archaeon ANME-1-THS]
MWAETYRPRRLDEIVGHEVVVRRLHGFINSRTIPNLVLWGPKGTGKTSLVYALAREFYGEHDEENLTHIEVLDFIEQGKKWLKEQKTFRFFYDEQKSALDIFKEMVREYAALSPITAPFKLLFFTNADLLHRDAQQALRRVMERSNRTCRFIFATTKPARIIPAIRSRCVNIHLRPLDKSGAFELLIRSIAVKEGLKIADGALNTLRDYARGDAGVALTLLEAAATAPLKRSTSPRAPHVPLQAREIDAKRIDEAAQWVFLQRTKAEELIDLVFEGRYTDMRARLEVLVGEERRGGKEIIAGIHEVLRRRLRNAQRKNETNLFARLFVAEGETDLKLCNALNSMIHLEEMLIRMSTVVESGFL